MTIIYIFRQEKYIHNSIDFISKRRKHDGSIFVHSDIVLEFAY